MAEEQMDMSLDDIIKAKPSMVKRGGRRSGGGGAPQGGGEGGRRGRGGPRGRSRGNGGGGAGRGPRPSPYTRETPEGRWGHDKFEGGRGGMRTGGGAAAAGRVGRGAVAKLLISNLEFSVNDQDIRELFSEFGPIRSYSVHYDRSGRSLGTADVTYHTRSDAGRALKTYNNVPLDGKPMIIELVVDEPAFGGGRANNTGGGGRPNSFRSINGNNNTSRPNNRGTGSGRGRGGRGGGGRRDREPKKTFTAEELDAQLDEYKKKD